MSRFRSRSRVASTPGLKFIRSNTVYGLSFIRLQFEYGRDYYFVRQQAINRLKDVDAAARRAAGHFAGRHDQRNLPLRIARTARHGRMQLKTLQDWVVERRLRIVPGVPTCSCLAARPRNIQAEIDLNRMVAHGLTLPQIISGDFDRATPMLAGARSRSANSRSTFAASASSASWKTSATSFSRQQGGVPVLLSDVAKVQIGFMPRLGIAGPRRHHGHRHRHRADAEIRTHDGSRASACARRGRTDQ